MEKLKLINRRTVDALAEERRAEVDRLYRLGHKQTEIADILGITQARVSQIMTTIERNRTNKRRMLRLMKPGQAEATA